MRRKLAWVPSPKIMPVSWPGATPPAAGIQFFTFIVATIRSVSSDGRMPVCITSRAEFAAPTTLPSITFLICRIGALPPGSTLPPMS